MTEFGEVWYIPADFVGVATTTIDVVPLTREVILGRNRAADGLYRWTGG